MIELTCPAEEGIETAREYKLGRYKQLKQDIDDAGWVGAWPSHNTGRCSWICRILYSTLLWTAGYAEANGEFAVQIAVPRGGTMLVCETQELGQKRELLTETDVLRRPVQGQTTA